MSHRTLILLVMVLGLVAACGATDPGPSVGATTTVASAEDPGEEPDQDGFDDEQATVESPAVDAAALDIALIEASELPPGIPVPVPAGGEPGSIVAFEGESYSRDYPPGNLARIAAFYDAWFADKGIEVEPTFGSSDVELWRVDIGGVPVQIELYELTNRDDERLLITWP